jgi:leucyl/phenylalanyl-tRNA---protein transferase
MRQLMRARSLSPESLLSAYADGAFPMTDDDGVTRFYTANPRGIIPLDQRFHVPGTLRQIIRQDRFVIRVNHDFRGVMTACMNAPRGDAEAEEGFRSWISPQLVEAYSRLHEIGHAHSVEAWQGGDLAGGLYGVSLGGAFFGESMFHRVRDASKVALVALVQRLRERGFLLLDAQASTRHLRRFGCVEVPARQYLKLLDAALEKGCRFVDQPPVEP